VPGWHQHSQQCCCCVCLRLQRMRKRRVVSAMRQVASVASRAWGWGDVNVGAREGGIVQA